MRNSVLLLFAVLALTACGIPGPVAENRSIAQLPRAVLDLPNGGHLSYLYGGDPNGPRIVFVHGTPGDASGWADYVMSPPKGMFAIAVDRPGFGESSPDGAVTSLKDQAAAISALLKSVAGVKSILVGHSLGGPIVAQIAVDYPERVGAIVIAAGSLDPAQEHIHWLQYVGDSWPVSFLLSRSMRNANLELMSLKPELEALAPRLKTIRAPIVVVHGTIDDLVPFANVDFMRRHFPSAPPPNFLVIKGMNHFLPWRAMDTMKRAIAIAAGRSGLTADTLTK
jgi:pimeloyl-ACP methyl ester carboxylesterase